MNYEKEIVELLLPHIDKIVTNYSADDSINSITLENEVNVSVKPRLKHPNEVGYNIRSLLGSIKEVLILLHDKDESRAELLLSVLQGQVAQALESINIYKSSIEDLPDQHCYCLAIQFYIGTYILLGEGADDSEVDQDVSGIPTSNVYVDERCSTLLSLL